MVELFDDIKTTRGAKIQQSQILSPELRHVSGLSVIFWTFLSNLVFYIKFWLLIVYL